MSLAEDVAAQDVAPAAARIVDTTEAAWATAASPAPRTQRGGLLRLVRSELRLVFGRRRNQVLLAALAVVPALIGVAIRVSTDSSGDGPPFLARVSGNGLFLVFTSLVVALPFFLPLALGVVSGDTVAGEAQAGTLRYLLVVPVSRPRLLLAKLVGGLGFTVAAVGVVWVVGLVTGLVLFPVSDVTLLSGDTVSYADGLLRAVGVAAYVVVSLAGLVAVGLLISTLTEVPVAAMAGTVAFAIVCEVLDALPQLSSIHGLLLTHHWLDFGELLRSSVDLGQLVSGLAIPLAYVAIAGALAWARFTTADVTA